MDNLDEDFHLFATGSGVTDKAQKRALLLHMVGLSVQEVHVFVTLPERGEANDYDKVVQS